MDSTIKDYFNEIVKALNAINESDITEIGDIIFDTYKRHKRIYIFGNGGSAATASHFALDLAKSSANLSVRKLPAISLSENMPLITAIANDTDYSLIFREQLSTLLESGDLVVAISASGNSPNIIEAVKFANNNGAVTVGICGFDGGELNKIARRAIIIANNDYKQIEDVHMIITHIIAREVRNKIEKESKV
jgi:D-sedoheptulose 7-phosphate isomerase